MPLGDGERASEQHSSESLHRNVDGSLDIKGGVQDSGYYPDCDALPNEGAWTDGRRSDCPSSEGSARVYDLVNCGPRHAFTVIDRDGNLLLVHNCFLIEPRHRYDSKGRKKPNVFPFITWEHQDYWFPKVREALGNRNVVVEKCRGEGWSWFMVLAALQDFLFNEDTLVGLVSSTEAKADSPSVGSLLGKADWELNHLPAWMTGVKGRDRNSPGDFYRHASMHAFIGTKNGNQITSFAAGPDVGRGDRFTWFGLDEHASDEWKKENNDEKVLQALGSTTDSILSISTPKGAFGAFYKLASTPSSDLKVTIDWRDNPTKNRGLYKLVDNFPVAVDPENNPLPKEYDPPNQGTIDLFSRLRKKGFDLDSKTRSPWLDRECDRGTSNPQNIAQEIERDYGGSVKRVFGPEFMEAVDQTTRLPDIIGELSVFDDLTYSFERITGGSFHLWCPLDSQGKPPNHNYVVACDVATGDGGEFCSNSALVVIDTTTKEQVLEYVTKTTKPNDFADKAIAVAKWFHGAFLAWEHGGPGTAFTTCVIDRAYGNIFKRITLDKATRKTTEKVGFVNRGEAREKLFADLYRYVRMSEVVVHSKPLGEEFTQYIRDEKDNIVHVSIGSTDSNHGDRVIAMGVAVQAMKSRPLGRPAVSKKPQKWDGVTEPPSGTLAHILWQQRKAAKANNDWDTRTAAEMAGVDVSVGSLY